jgi:hypothetical protein
MNAPGLWSDIDIDCSKSNLKWNWIEEMFRRSKMAPLTVQISGSQDLDAETLKSIWKHMSRTRELRIYRNLKSLGDILPVAAPLLEKFTFSSYYGRFNKTFPEDFVLSGDLPSLRQVDLKYCHLSWGSPSFRRLTSLSVTFSDVPVLPVSMTQILTSLSCLSNLEILHLNRFPHVPPGTMAVPSRSILLPCLTVLSVQSDIVSCSYLLDHFILPPLASLSLSCHIFDENHNIHYDFSSILPTLEYWSDTNRLREQMPIRFFCCFDDGSDAIFFGSSDPINPYETYGPYLRLHFSNTWEIDTVHLVCKALWLQHVESLRVEFSSLEKSGWLECFGSLERLRSLKICHSSAGASFMEALLPAQMTDAPSFPALQYLTFEKYSFQTSVAMLRTCLEQRRMYQQGIQKLSFRNCSFLSAAQAAQLKEIVPMVDWEENEVEV